LTDLSAVFNHPSIPSLSKEGKAFRFPFLFSGALISFLMLLPLVSHAQQACPDPASAQAAWQQALFQVDTYRSTYVLIYPDRLAEKFPSFGPSTDAKLKIGVINGPALELSRKARITNTVEYEVAGEPDQILRDLQADKIQGAIAWAPLAGWMLNKLDTAHELSMRVSGEALAPPQDFTITSAQPANPDVIASCSDAIRVLLESYGVVPAEKFKLDIYEIMAWQESAENDQKVKEGGEIFERYCASCHGKNAVMVSSLAPVNLLYSLPNFTFGGFSYITLKGRNTRGMPGYHGILEEEQLQKLFQYLIARSGGRLPE
jgi:mono/diheme cytochrome c family protein